MVTAYHRIEQVIGVLLVASIPAVIIAGNLEWQISSIRLFQFSGILLLAQGLLRDLVLLTFYRDQLFHEATPKKGPWICVESTIGVGLIGVYLLLNLLDVTGTTTLSGTLITILLAGIWWFGYLTRDHVLELKKEPNHLNLVFGFRSSPPASSPEN